MGIEGGHQNTVGVVPLSAYPDALIPAGGRGHWRDWFGVRFEDGEHFDALALPSRVPGVQVLKDGSFLYHLSHLPLFSERVVRAALPRAPFVDATFADGTVLRPHQVFGAGWIRQRAGALLADEMRVGKTGQVVASHDPASGPLVVCAPLNTRRVWLSWMRRRWPGVDPFVVEGREPRPEMQRAPLVFCHHEILAAHQVLGDWRPGTLVLDEAHKFANGRSARTRGAQLLSTNAARVIAVTGTPMWNRPPGMYPILSIVSPGAWGSWREYAERYCDGRPGPWGMVAEGVSHLDEFQARLSEVMLRREWEQVGAGRPTTHRKVEVVPLSQAEHYEIDKLVAQARSGSGNVAVADLAVLRGVVAKRKAGAVADLSGGLGLKHHVIWTWHREFARALAHRVLGFCVTGDTPPARREAVFDEWERRGGPLVLTMSVGEVGIDLSAADTAIFAELDWTPAVMAQAEMRTFAPHREMTVHYFAVDHRVDREITRALGKKLGIAEKMGVPAAEAAIGVISRAFDVDPGEGSLDRLAAAVLGRGTGA